jgi:hypothetical protein
LKKALVNANTKVFSNMDLFQIVYKVTKDMLIENAGYLYLDDLDTTICIGKNDAGIVHPESSVGRDLRFSLDAKNAGFSYRIMIVDPENEYGARYINIGGQVYKLKPLSDDHRTPGVYLFVSAPEGEEQNGWRYFSYEEADEQLPLFRTASDAIVLGDVAGERKAELEAMEAQRKLEELELRREVTVEKGRYEKLSLELKKKMDEHDDKQKRKQAKLKAREAELAHQIKLLETKMDEQKQLRDAGFHQLKYELDTRSAIRKDSSDSMKYMWPVLAGVGAFLIPKLL